MAHTIVSRTGLMVINYEHCVVSSLPDGGILYVSLESQLAVFAEKSRFIQWLLATVTEIKRMMF